MSSSYQRVWRERGLPVASIAADETAHGRLIFTNSNDLNRAWDLGTFYLKTLDKLDLESARRFGRELIDRDSPHRQIPQYGKLEGFIALENNQQTKLALRRERWDRYYPTDIAALGRMLDAMGITIMREVFLHPGIPDAL
ncbi:MAG: hypothetical protein HOK02_04970 [Halieaceae bacterium]|jgi:hypothetical protein|nr:hypothetical protein [Halieaceae bacterium]